MSVGKLAAGAMALGAAMLLGLSVPSAQAGFTVTLEQVGTNVVATGSGAIDLTGLSFIRNNFNDNGFIHPIDAVLVVGGAPEDAAYAFTGGPGSFGSGGGTTASSFTGDPVDIVGVNEELSVPLNYISGTALSDTATWDNASLSSLGVTPGIYEWTWGVGVNQNVTLDAMAATVVPEPEPSSLLLLGAALAGLLCLCTRAGSTI